MPKGTAAAEGGDKDRGEDDDERMPALIDEVISNQKSGPRLDFWNKISTCDGKEEEDELMRMPKDEIGAVQSAEPPHADRDKNGRGGREEEE